MSRSGRNSTSDLAVDHIARQGDVLPAERGDMGQQVIRNGNALHFKLPHGAVEIDGVPMDDGRGDQAEARGAEALVLERAVADLALAMEEHRATQRIAGLALIEPGMAALAQVGV